MNSLKKKNQETEKIKTKTELKAGLRNSGFQISVCVSTCVTICFPKLYAGLCQKELHYQSHRTQYNVKVFITFAPW